MLKYYSLLQKNKNKANITQAPLVPLLKAVLWLLNQLCGSFSSSQVTRFSLIWSIRCPFQTLEGKFVNLGSWEGEVSWYYASWLSGRLNCFYFKIISLGCILEIDCEHFKDSCFIVEIKSEKKITSFYSYRVIHETVNI